VLSYYHPSVTTILRRRKSVIMRVDFGWCLEGALRRRVWRPVLSDILLLLLLLLLLYYYIIILLYYYIIILLYYYYYNHNYNYNYNL
jgi:hypothetical protein